MDLEALGAMIDLALLFLKDQLNTYLATRTGATAVEVKLSRVVDEAGKYAFGQETISVSVINIEEERTLRSQVPEPMLAGGQHVMREPELKLNLHVLFAANFKLYDEALKYVSHVLTFFQSHPVFTPAEHPALDPRIERLVMELQSLSYEQLNQVWAYLGGKYLPSVIYRARLIILQAEAPEAVQPPITVIRATLQRR